MQSSIRNLKEKRVDHYHTGVKFHGYEVTISQRGKVQLEPEDAHEWKPHESEHDFKKRLVTALLNAGISVVQSQITGVARRAAR
jgi:hypothetical protein